MENIKTKIVAHRGCSADYPENTLLAFQKAIENAADFIELDVHKTSDEVLVVIHDNTIDRTNSDHATGLISEMTFAELSNINMGYSAKFGNQFKDEKISTLKQVLDLAKGKIKVCVEIKVVEAEKEILEIIHHLEMEKEIVIFSFYEGVLKNIRNLDAEINTLFLVEKFEHQDISTAKKLGCFAIGVGNETNVNKELLQLLHAENVELWQYTIDDEAEMNNLIHLGLDGLITNRPKDGLTLR
ncbi:glycerophosphodiester phosphodiesterase [Frigoriflavimonas asaccharolytica]|uniref:Glycerophosphoryl diester phosphodiesterase n=1 Tax=Frigoriflavimonas asaccharolytica TaxID=2735899 RepID=A0A8J8G7Q0_9FLAO|nr:glycerophosphodiester phosphodiesterase family protein [Frigoriflavimonas asaccharolytica]NRS92844.1 glycerophosphoryl diester phosphodiesterase [Frigoriflavimonas asaccharolytica]